MTVDLAPPSTSGTESSVPLAWFLDADDVLRSTTRSFFVYFALFQVQSERMLSPRKLPPTGQNFLGNPYEYLSTKLPMAFREISTPFPRNVDYFQIYFCHNTLPARRQVTSRKATRCRQKLEQSATLTSLRQVTNSGSALVPFSAGSS